MVELPDSKSSGWGFESPLTYGAVAELVQAPVS